RRNYRYFILTLLLSNAQSLFTCVLSVTLIALNMDNIKRKSLIICIIFTIVSCSYTFSTINLLNLHLRMINQSITTSELCKYTYSYVAGSPYHRGALKNWIDLLFEPQSPSILDHIDRSYTPQSWESMNLLPIDKLLFKDQTEDQKMAKISLLHEDFTVELFNGESSHHKLSDIAESLKRHNPQEKLRAQKAFCDK
uniref:Uncharacterized protein n=1 Tax=Romanomermis culicivorax TaxID=13658 RepID=A0A915L0Q0_ROMCU